jgi:hypothetical protein
LDYDRVPGEGDFESADSQKRRSGSTQFRVTRKRSAIVRLNRRCAHATAIPGFPDMATTHWEKGRKNGRYKSIPAALNSKLVIPVARATGLIPTLAINAVDVEPTFAPMTMGIAACPGRMPCWTRRMASPVLTLLD